jgi:hypothetical protein
VRARHRTTAVILRCRGRGHELLTVRPATGVNRFLVVRAPGRAGGGARDTDQWLRVGAGTEMNFATLPELSREIHGGDASTVTGLLGDSPYLFCRCGATRLSESDADRIGEAVFDWFEGAKHGPTRPITVTVQI